MAVPLQTFLATALGNIVPGAAQPQAGQTIHETIVPCLTLEDQASRIEWQTLCVVATIAAKAVFTFPAVPRDEIHFYRLLAGHLTVGGSFNIEWKATLEYPGFESQIAEVDAAVEEIPGLNILNRPTPNSPDRFLQHATQPIRVYPRGVLRFCRVPAVAIGDRVCVTFLRQVYGGPASAESVVSGLTASGLI